MLNSDARATQTRARHPPTRPRRRPQGRPVGGAPVSKFSLQRAQRARCAQRKQTRKLPYR
eukprot:3289752-Pyramimonas_sp.AAC.1